MGLWLWEDRPPMTFALADLTTELQVALIRNGAWDDDPDDSELPCCDVVDLAAVRACRGGP